MRITSSIQVSLKKSLKSVRTSAILAAFLLLLLFPSLDVNAQWKQRGNSWYYYTASGSMLKSRWIDTWYVNRDGRWVKSFEKTSKGIRWKNGSSGYLKDKWKTIDGSRYYFNRKGYLAAKVWVDGKYLQSDGKYLKGLEKTKYGLRFREKDGTYISSTWKSINSRKFYFDKNGYAVKNKSMIIKGVKYAFDKNGCMKPGLRTSSSKTRYQSANGTYLTSQWKKTGGKWKYFNSSGNMVKGKWIGDSYVDRQGNRVSSTWVQGKFIDASGKRVNANVLNLSAPSAILIDGGSGRVIYQKNANQNRANASTTKIMTAILAMEHSGMEDQVSVSAYAASQEEVKLYMNPGEVYRMKDLMYALLLPSYNDVATAIAEHVAGSESKFANMMNEKARQLGCTNTTFVTPNGLEAGNHGTSAADLAKMARYALEKPLFREIIKTQSYQFQCLSNTRSFTVRSTDDFLNQMEGAIGVKTGWTTLAGNCFVGAVSRGGKTYISVVLGCPSSSTCWQDTQALMNYGISNYG